MILYCLILYLNPYVASMKNTSKTPWIPRPSTLAGARWAAAASRSFWRSYRATVGLGGISPHLGEKTCQIFVSVQGKQYSKQHEHMNLSKSMQMLHCNGQFWLTFLHSTICQGLFSLWSDLPESLQNFQTDGENKNMNVRRKFFFEFQGLSLQLRISDFPKNAITNGQRRGDMNPISHAISTLNSHRWSVISLTRTWQNAVQSLYFSKYSICWRTTTPFEKPWNLGQKNAQNEPFPKRLVVVHCLIQPQLHFGLASRAPWRLQAHWHLWLSWLSKVTSWGSLP